MRLFLYLIFILLTTHNNTASCMKRTLEDANSSQAIAASPEGGWHSLPFDVQKRLIALNPIKNVMRLASKAYYEWVRWENKEVLLAQYPEMPMSRRTWHSIMPILCVQNKVALVQSLCTAQPKSTKWLRREDLNHRLVSEYGHTEEIIEVLKQHGAPFTALENHLSEPFKPLHDAILLDDRTGVEAWLTVHADRTPFDIRALYLACLYRRYTIAQRLITFGINTMIQCEDDQTLLHLAAAHSTDSFLRLLLNTDAKRLINVRNTGWEMPLMIALKSKQSTSDIVKLLLANDAAINNLHHYTLRATPLWLAIYYRKSMEIIATLLNARLEDINHVPENSRSCCALSLAVQGQNYELVSLLIKHGACINNLEPHDMTPLKRAIKRLDLRMVKHLLREGKAQFTDNGTFIPQMLSFCLTLFLTPSTQEADKEIVQQISKALCEY